MASPTLKFKRGAFADLPTLAVGEPGFTTDRFQLFVGSPEGNQIIGGGNFFNLESTTEGGGIKLFEATNNGNNFIELQAPDSLDANLELTLPRIDGSANQVLQTDGSGVLSFRDVELVVININGGTDIGAPIEDEDIFIVDDGASGTNRKVTASRLATYFVGGNHSGNFSEITVGSAVTINSSGIDAPTGIITAINFVGDFTGDLTGTVLTSSQTNITSVGTLNSLAVTNNITVGGSVDGRDVSGDGLNQDALQELSGVSAGSTNLGTFTGTIITDDKNTKEALQELETSLENLVDGNGGAATVITVSDTSNQDFFLTFVDSNNVTGEQEAVKTNSNIKYNPASSLLTIEDVIVGSALTVTGDITANGNIVGDNNTNITNLNQVTATTFVGNLTGVSTGTTRVDVNDITTESSTFFIGVVNGEGFQQVGQDDNLTFIPNQDLLNVVNLDLTGFLRFDGAGVEVDGITDEDDMSSDSDTKVPTQQSVKAYVDTTVAGVAVTFLLDADSGTPDLFETGSTLTFSGTTNEVNTVVSDNNITIGLPDTVNITTELNVPTVDTGAIRASDGTAAQTISNSTGKVTTSTDHEVQGTFIASGNAQFQGITTIGDASSDTVVFTSRVNSNFIPSTDGINDLGSSSLSWENGYINNISGENINTTGIITANEFKGSDITLTGGGNFGGNVEITGNLSVGGSITNIDVEDLRVVSPVIELGLQRNDDGTLQPPENITTYNSGIAMYYNHVGVSSDNAQIAAMFANVANGNNMRIGFATDVTLGNVGGGQTDTVETVNNWAEIEVKALWINDCAGVSQVITCTGSERFLENISVDGGSF